MIVKPPNTPSVYKTSVFLAGGISNCPDWQNKLAKTLETNMGETIQIFNPRWDYKWTAPEQIEWEFKYLREVDIISYWFSKGTLNPIVLYELGMWGNSTGRPICIGVDPEYERKLDVVLQTKLARPNIVISYDLNDLAVDIWKTKNNLERS